MKLNSFPALTIAYVPVLPETVEFITSRQLEEALIDISDGLIAVYQFQFEAVSAVDTGQTKDSVRKRVISKYVREVVADSPARIIEHGWIYRARGQDSYPGRWPAGKAVVMLDAFVVSAFTRQLMR